MNPQRFEVDIIVLTEIKSPHLVHLNGLSVITIGPRLSTPKKLLRLYRLFREREYEIVFTHSWNTLVEGALAARLAGVPRFIHGEHGTLEHSPKNRWLQKLLWKQAETIVVVAESIIHRSRAELGYSGNNFKVIHNGVDTERFYPNPVIRDEIRLKQGWQGKFVIGHMGRFFEVKDHPTLVRAFAIVHQKYPESQLVLVGGGGKIGQKRCRMLKELISELGLKDAVRILEPTDRPEIYYNGFDLFVLPSLSEGCSNVLLEAMATGLPIIATNVGGNPELIKDGINGLLVPPASPEELAGAMIRLIQDKDLRSRFSKAGRQIACEKFSMENCVRHFEELYTSNQQIIY